MGRTHLGQIAERPGDFAARGLMRTMNNSDINTNIARSLLIFMASLYIFSVLATDTLASLRWRSCGHALSG